MWWSFNACNWRGGTLGGSLPLGVPLPIMALVDSPLRQREVDVTLALRERHLYDSETTVIVFEFQRTPLYNYIYSSRLR